LRPDYAEAHSNRGNALQELKRFDEAVASYDRALAQHTHLAEAHSNRGNALRELARFAEALASYDRAQAARPHFADAHFNEGMCRLLIGDLPRGWEKAEWRWGTEQLRNGKRNFSQPLWLGADAIAGKTILLRAEQGLGDTIHFAALRAACCRARRPRCSGSAAAAARADAFAFRHSADRRRRRVPSGLRSAMSVAQPAAGIQDAAGDDSGADTISLGDCGQDARV
jgi:tetratricopeptide (TPR) repeat protein